MVKVKVEHIWDKKKIQNKEENCKKKQKKNGFNFLSFRLNRWDTVAYFTFSNDWNVKIHIFRTNENA